MRHAALILAFVCLAAAGVANAQERVHSDLPLFTGRDEPIWPQGFTAEDEWGCGSRVVFGDWKFVESAEKAAEAREQWLRLENYGVFHCAAIERWADEREDLGKRDFKYSWFVELGRVRRDGGDLELWALQSGSRPGSDYLLLARKPEAGAVKSFDVLPVDCPRENRRLGDGPDIWRADYCAINSRRGLKSFAKKMAGRSPVGKLTFVDNVPENSDSVE